MAFPTTIDDTTTIPVESSSTSLSTNHVTSHTAMQTAIIAIETLMGITASAVTGTFNYILGEITGSDKAVGKTATQTLTNKTLGTGTKIALGSDATGDIYYNSGSTTVARKGIGSTGDVLTVSGGLPVWSAPAASADSSYAAKGVVRFLTDAPTSGITIASGIANVNFGTGANQIVKLNGSSQLPAVDGSLVIGVNPMISMVQTISSSSTTTTITHSLGVIPRYAYFRCVPRLGTGKSISSGVAVWNNSTGVLIRENATAYNFDSNGSVSSFTTSTAGAYTLTDGSPTTLNGSCGTTTSSAFTMTHSTTTGAAFDIYIELYA